MLAAEQTGSGDTRLNISVLGGFSLQTGDGRTLPIANRKARGLLAYLALNPSRRESRERLAGLLWSDRGEDLARASLRQCLKQLRKLFNEIQFDGFRAERQDVSLSVGSVHLDLNDASEGLSQNEISPSLLIEDGVPDRILYGLETLDESFAAWLHVIRKNWHDRLVGQLQECLRKGSQEAGKRAAEVLVNIDPTHEEAHRFLIRIHADAGNIALALKQYKLLWDLLDEEFDMEPDESTQSLIADIKAGTYQTAKDAASTPADAKNAEKNGVAGILNRLPVVAVWNFIQGGPWTQESYIIDGFRRELIASLVRFREWVVVDGSPGLDLSNLQGGPTSQIDYQLEGTYLEDSGTVRLVITLKELASRRYIWSEQISLTLDNWFAAQQDIVRRTSIALNIYLSVERVSAVSGGSGIPLDLYDHWLRGQELTLKWRPDAHEKAKQIFHSIIDEAPDFGRAFSSLVQIENAEPLVHPGVHRTEDKMKEVVRLGKEAVHIDPLDSRAQLCLGWAYAINGQFDNAEINLGLACELNENDPWTLVSSALGLAFCDNREKAQQLSDQAFALGLPPSTSNWGYLATLRFLLDDYQGCVEAVDLADDALINLAAWKASACSHLGRTSEAEDALQHFLTLARLQWLKPDSADERDISAWFMQCFPIKSRSTRQRLRGGLKNAGLHFYES